MTELRETFDTVAELYARARPTYPDEIVAAIPTGRVLEVACATAWGWIGDVKYRKAHDALRPGGHLALIAGYHVFPKDEDPFFRAIQELHYTPETIFAGVRRLAGDVIRKHLLFELHLARRSD